MKQGNTEMEATISDKWVVESSSNSIFEMMNWRLKDFATKYLARRC